MTECHDKKQIISDSIYLLCVLIIVMFGYLYGEKIVEHSGIGYIAVFLGCFISNVTVLLPAPGLLIVMQYSLLLNQFGVAILGAIGSSLGEINGYIVGKIAGKYIEFDKLVILSKFNRFPYAAIFLLAVLPLPLFDIAGILAGSKRIDIKKFWLVCFIGKLIKMLYVVWFVGNISDFIAR